MIDDAELEAWCLEHLGSVPVRRLFAASHLSSVVGLELADGRRAVVKVRPPSDRLAACVAVQAELFAHGFPCAEVLVGLRAFGDRVATAEAYIPHRGSPPASPAPVPCAHLLAALVERTPPAAEHPALAEVLPWAGWDHGGAGVWPPPDDLDVDLDATPHGWLEDAAVRVTRRLASVGADVIGHVDWEAQNLEWLDGEPVAVHDWDSLAIRAESTIAGLAAAVHPAHGPVVFASVEETERFLAAYAERRPLRDAQLEEAWAAGAWVLAFNAKKETCGGGGGYVALAEHELDERLRRAGA